VHLRCLTLGCIRSIVVVITLVISLLLVAMVVCLLQRVIFFTLAVVHTVGVRADCYAPDGAYYPSLLDQSGITMASFLVRC
jgi:hypothetical protein